MLLLIIGLPGSGKTTLARAYAEQYGAVHLNSDQVRAELNLRGQYSATAKQRVYDELVRRIREALQAGHRVVVDSVLHREAAREPFRAVAAECGAACRWVLLRVSDDTARMRLARTRPDSEATIDVYEQLQAEWEELSDPHLTLHADAMAMEDLLNTIHHYTL